MCALGILLRHIPGMLLFQISCNCLKLLLQFLIGIFYRSYSRRYLFIFGLADVAALAQILQVLSQSLT